MLEKRLGKKDIYASKIPIEFINANGQSYQFSKNKLLEQFSLEGALNKILKSAIVSVDNSRDVGVLEGKYIFWFSQYKLINQQQKIVEGISLLISPLFIKYQESKLYEDPCYETMSTIRGFIRAEGANPILFNAFPRYVYKRKEIHNIVIDELFLKESAILKHKLENRRTFKPVVQSNSLNQYKLLLDRMGI